MSAYFGKKIQMAELLLDFGANPNHVNHVRYQTIKVS